MARELPALIAALAVFACAPAFAAQEEYSFAGGTITIAENDDYEKIVSFNGAEIGRDYMAFFDRVANVGGVDVALIELGAGGNACGTYTLLVWPDGAGGVNTASPGDDCRSPLAAVAETTILFVPYVGPGESMTVRRWSPQEGFSTAGILTFAPESGTGWKELAAEPAIYPVDYFSNEAFYAYASQVLGGDLEEFAAGLGVSSEMQAVGGDFYAASGCVPHNCGGEDSLLVVDVAKQKAWFAQQRDGAVALWPEADTWPAAARDSLSLINP